MTTTTALVQLLGRGGGHATAKKKYLYFIFLKKLYILKNVYFRKISKNTKKNLKHEGFANSQGHIFMPANV